jgi:hypothetical protein
MVGDFPIVGEVQPNDQWPCKRCYNFEPFTIGNYTRQKYPPLILFAWTTFHDVTHPPALFESLRDKYTIFVLCINPLAEALGQILKKNGVSTLRASKTGQVHLVHILSLCHLYWLLEEYK